jgi:hypothetical protein
VQFLQQHQLRATRLRTKDGKHVRLGNVNEDNVDAALPFPEIGARIAERAGVKVVDGGTVRRSIERDVLSGLGLQPAEDVKRRDVIAILDAIVQRGAPVRAKPDAPNDYI